MYKMMLFARRKPGLSPEEFREHYEAWHAPWGSRRFFGDYVVKYVRNHVKRGDYAPIWPWPGDPANRTQGFDYDVVVEWWFASATSFAEWQEWKSTQPDGDLLSADEYSFFDTETAMCVFVDEVEEIRQEPAQRPAGSPPLEANSTTQ